MKGSLVLTFLIALYAVQDNGAATVNSSAETPSTTPITTASTAPSTTASTAPSTTASTAPSTAPSTTPSTTASTTPSTAPSTTASTAPSTTPSTTANTTASTAPSTTASTTASTAPSTAASTTASTAPSTTPNTTPSTTANTTASTTLSTTPSITPSTTPAPSTTSTLASSSPESTPAQNSTSAPSTSESTATGSNSTAGTPSASEPTTTGSPSTSVSTNSSSAPTSSATGGISVPTSSATNLPSTTQGSLPLPCVAEPCKYGATCINLNTERVCQCPYGFFYGLSGCQLGKVFPGQLQLNEPYDEVMQNTRSSAYQELFNNVTQLFREAFENCTDYGQTILVSVEQSSSTFTMLRTATTTDVKIINMFDESTNLTESEVTDIIDKSLNASGAFKNISQCDIYGCDNDTTNCDNPKDAHPFPTCTCKQDLARKNPEDKACLLCNDQCTSENHRQCLHVEKGVPSCSCQPGYKSKNKKCEACSFGFSGKDCSDSSLAILVGVAAACGVVIVVLTGVLIYKLLRGKKEASLETRSLLNSEGSSTGRVPQSNFVTNVPTREKIFPRVQTRNPAAVNKTVMDSQEGRARNIQEPGIANKAYIPEQDYDDDDSHWMEMSARNKF